METAYSTMILLMQVMPNRKDADVLKDIRRKVKAGETQYPSFDVFDPERHKTAGPTLTMFMAEPKRMTRMCQSVDCVVDLPSRLELSASKLRELVLNGDIMIVYIMT